MQVVQPELTAAEDLLLRLILPVFGAGFAAIPGYLQAKRDVPDLIDPDAHREPLPPAGPLPHHVSPSRNSLP